MVPRKRFRTKSTEPAEPLSVESAVDACLRLLALRARTREELVRALKRKGYDAALQEEALIRIARYGYLNDEGFAVARAAGLLRQGKLGPRGVVQRLLGHGLSMEQSKSALQSALDQSDFQPIEAARSLLARRGLWGRVLEPREKARAARFLQARGFTTDTVRVVLREAGLDPSELPMEDADP